METWGIVIFAALAALGLLFILWLIFGCLLLPVKKRAGEDIVFVLKVTGNDPGIAESVRGLLWLRQSLGLTPDITIVDTGMDKATLESACKIAASGNGINIITTKEVDQPRIWMNKTGS